MKYDLDERTTKFAEDIIELCRKCPKNTITIPILDQLIKSGTSMGANYMEANGAASRKDFKNKTTICKKEGRETKYWLRLLSKAEKSIIEECRILWQEAHELTLIFSKIVINSK